jgi:4-alpha-glucanotransferase
MYVVQFEQRLSSKALKPPPAGSVASLGTHDTSTFAAHWRGLDISFRVRLGLLSKQQAKGESARRKKLNACTVRFLRRKRFLHRHASDTKAVMTALLHWLSSTRAGLVLVLLEDLWAETRPQNVPGTSDEYPNWRRKTKMSLETI